MPNSSTILAQADPEASTPAPAVLRLVPKPKRTPEQDEDNRDFLACAGRVEFGRQEATLQDIWMAFAYYASLGDERTCYASLENIGCRARRSDRTVRRAIPSLMARGLILQASADVLPDIPRCAPTEKGAVIRLCGLLCCPLMSGQGGHRVRRSKRSRQEREKEYKPRARASDLPDMRSFLARQSRVRNGLPSVP